MDNRNVRFQPPSSKRSRSVSQSSQSPPKNGSGRRSMRNSNLSPVGGGRLSERGMMSLSGGGDQMFNFNAQDLDQFHLASKTKANGSPVRSPTKSEASYPQEEMSVSQNVSPTPGAYSFLRETMGMTSTSADAAMMDGAEMEGGEGMDPDGMGMEGGAEDGALPVGGTAEMAEMVTGEDAINFFALYRATSSVKFVHLVRERTGINFRPYDLKVIPAAECETGGAGSDQYFTMSAAGLVHVRPGEPSEFVPLGEWMRQSTLFNMLRSIRFFKYYLHSKCFTTWHQNVRFKLYCQQRAKLKNRMFLAKESFCEPLLELKKEMLDVQNVALLDLKMKIFAASDFVDHQQLKRAEAAKHFETCMEKVQSTVQKVCSDVTTLARSTDNGEAPLDLTLASMTEKRNMSMVALKKEEADRRKMLRRAEQEADMLSDFIRLADYVAVESLVQLIINTMNDFKEELHKPRKQGLFETTVKFAEEGSVFTPNCPAIQSMISVMTEAMISSVANVTRVLFLRPFTEHVQRMTDTPNINEIVRASVHFRRICKTIDEKIDTDFAEANQYVVEFDKVRPIYEYNLKWDFEVYRREVHTVKSLQEEMDKIANWEKELDRMRAYQSCGILQVVSRNLRSELQPLTADKMVALKSLVKDLARHHCKEQMGKYKTRVSKLSQRPQHLKDFAAQIEAVAQLQAEEKVLFRHSQMVEQMYKLLQDYDVKVLSDDLVQLEELRAFQQSYVEELDAAASYKETRMPEMTQQLDISIGNLNDAIRDIGSSLEEGVYINASFFDDPQPVLAELAAVKAKLDNVDQRCAQYSASQRLFDITEYKYPQLVTAKGVYERQEGLWNMINDWNEHYDTWMNSPFTELDVEEINKEVQVYFKDSFALHKKLGNDVSMKLKDKTSDFKSKMGVILELGNPNMRDRHWEKIFGKLGQAWYPAMEFSLADLIQFGILNFSEIVTEQSAAASGEAQLEKSLESILHGWDNTEFITMNHRDQKGVFILGALEEIFTLLEDNQVTLQTMMGSRFISGVQQEVEVWEKKLALLSETLDEWTACQRNWMYLETIFSAEDIQKQLPVEAQKFAMVDKLWKANLKACNEKPNVIASIDAGDKLLREFQHCNKTLEDVQKSLEDYLQTKRMAFPRFYFLSNDDLLEILSQTRDPHAVQPHMGKCFDAIKSINFGEGPQRATILGYNDPKTETVNLSEGVEAEGPVETWLLAFQAGMVRALYDNMKKSVLTYPEHGQKSIERKEWLFSFPAQVGIAVDQIIWSDNMAKSLEKIENGENPNAVKDFLAFSLEQLEFMVSLVRGDITNGQRGLCGAMITIDVHARDVTRQIIKKDVDRQTDFEWTRQLRYYWEPNQMHEDQEGECTAKQTNTRFLYAYEYLGNSPRLVITPLTDMCYMTLTGALHLKLGGAPAGPAGTGKTETTKDLGKALAVYCVVFNCSDGLDYKIMGRFFSGLAQQGAWACFDEFNRIDIEVLSVIAQQILCIQQALLTNLVEFDFEGTMIPLNTNFGVFITMNPGYAGRTELPDNLKALFRPVAMMVPDYRLIAEIILFSEGFANALPLSNKMSQLYALSSEQLSKQDHYDFGMRAVKTVLVCAGQLKRKEPETIEDLLLIRAMRDSNVPKFLEHDLPLFQGILSDLFPGMVVPYVDYGLLQKAIENQLAEMQLQPVPSFISKVIQVHETQLVRHGMMVVGEAGAGKSANVRVLAAALTQLKNDGVVDRDEFYKVVDRLILNPKSITAGELYGEFNMMTGEWKDGIVPKLVRQCVNASNEGSDNRKWIIFDGPVDAIWIENMNTVLDDNKTLCLANSERIKLPGTLHMMFEVQDLSVASPATVSRCGMVYMEQVHVGMLSIVRSWGSQIISQLLPDQSDSIITMIEGVIEAAVKFVRTKCKEKVPSNDHNLVQSLLNLLESLLDPAKGFDAAHPNIDRLIKMYFVWALVWSIGGNIDDKSRPLFQDWVKDKCSSLVPESPEFFSDVYGFVVNPADTVFSTWDSLMDSFTFDHDMPYFNILVPTTDTTRYTYLLNKLMKSGFNVLYMGETGVGKSVIMQAFLDNMGRTSDYVSFSMAYSAQTKPSNLKDVMETKLEKKRKNLFGPPAGKNMLFFIDDLNMPALETYGAQPPNELLRQLIDQGGFYDTTKLFFKFVKDLIFCGSCAPPGGGRNAISPRLLRHFSMVWLTNVSEAAMARIFTTILSGFLSQDGFSSELKDLAAPIVNSSISIYERVQHDMLPTPMKSHYTFNLRDLSKVFQGVLMVDPKHIPTKDDVLKLWIHEESRVFRDRLIDEDDRVTFNAIVKDLLKSNLDHDWEVEEFKDIMYGDYLTREDKEYRPVTEPTVLHDLLVEYLEEYNMNFPTQMHLVFFSTAVQHISRICRVLRQPRGNAMLVGVGGSGRQSLTRLATFMAEYKLLSIEITRGYGPNEFHENLKEVLMCAGAENKQTVFLMSDTQVVYESFLEDINNILNAGEVPNLFETDEMERIVGLVRPLAKEAGKMETRDVILKHFIQLVRENLHIVLAMSPIGAGFRNRCRMFPSLVNCCTIDWFNAWPEDALYSVAHVKLEEKCTECGIAQYVDPLCKMALSIHQSVEKQTAKFFDQLKRYNYTTPTSYLELIQLYINMLSKEQDRVTSAEGRYRGGLQKITECEGVVEELQKSLVAMAPELEKAGVETAELLIKVEKDQKAANAQQAIVEVEVEAATKTEGEVSLLASDVQKDLDEALPAYFAAIKALDALDKNSINELKAFKTPPEMVVYTFDAVCLLFHVKPGWKEAKGLMSDMKFLENLGNYDKDNIDPKVIKKLQKHYNNPDFLPEKVGKISAAAMCICAWVRAMITYDKVAKTIEPKKKSLAEAQASLAEVQALLKVKVDALNEVLSRVAQLQALLKATEKKKADLEAQEQKCKVQLERAEQLIGGLGGEKIRWAVSADRLKGDLINLVGNIIVSAGFIAYLGPFTAEYRIEMAEQWVMKCKELEIPSAAEFSLEAVLADPVEVRRWQMQGLPADNFSTENGMLTTMGRRWPLMIDPQGQANKWVRNMYSALNLQIIKLSQKDFLRTLENGIRYGAPVMLENVQEELDPALEPVLLKQIFKRGGQYLIHIGDSDVPYSDDFRFFITTKMANPHYMPEVCIKVTIINFTVTMSGLEDQLLVDVIKSERPDLEEKKDELVVNIAADKTSLKEIEEKILFMLANASGNILDDSALIEALGESKKTSAVIEVRLAEAEETTREINETREGYRTVATRGSIIYFVIANLALVDPMYQYSLQFFKSLYVHRLERSEKSDNVMQRLEILLKDITQSMYLNICRGLFEKDKMIFSFLMGANISRHAGVVSAAEWKCIMVGPGVIVDEATKRFGDPGKETWLLNNSIWDDLVMMEHTMSSAYGGLAKAVLANPSEWKAAFVDSVTPQYSKLPGAWEEKLTNFQRLLILRAFRKEKVVFGLRVYIGKELGQQFTESPAFDLAAAYDDSTKTTPLIFILSSGADPNDYLIALAKEKDKILGETLKIISLGQGQGPIAEALFKQGRQTGDWICLQNCHLAVSWLGRLEMMVEEAGNEPDQTNDDFRLWLTSNPSPKFPVPVLQTGIKITNEPPKGMRANLLRTFTDISAEEYLDCKKPFEYQKLLFTVAFFNALILERRNFGAVGWNIFYGWMNSDLKAALQQVKMYVEEQEQVPWDTLAVLVADITYGGRVTDAQDKRSISSIVRRYLPTDGALLTDEFRLSSSDTYSVPVGTIDSVRDFIRSLPVEDAPEIFGLHENADITLQQKDTKSIIDTVIMVAGSGGGGGGGGGEDELVTGIATTVMERMPDAFDLELGHEETFKKIESGAVNSLGVFLGQELVMFNVLVNKMKSTLYELGRAVKGIVVMSGPLEEMYNCFLFQRVPGSWEKAGYPCLKPLNAWIEDFFARITFMSGWLLEGPRDSYWISGFFFPQGFMTSIKQTFSREYKIAVDILTVTCEVKNHGPEEVKEADLPKDGVLMHGLFMEAGRFDRPTMEMAESLPALLFDPMPCLWLKPMVKEDYNPGPVYVCPVYKTSIRAGTLSTTGHSTNFVCYMDIPSSKEMDHWIRRGCAMLCMLDT